MGKVANHALVMANLVVDGKNHGMHPFIVQIRDLNTHLPLPGIVAVPVLFCLSQPKLYQFNNTS